MNLPRKSIVDCPSKPVLLFVGPVRPTVVQKLQSAFTVHPLFEALNREGLLSTVSADVRAMAVTYSSPTIDQKIDSNFLRRFPGLGIVSSFGVGYDHVDAKWAGEHGITVTNTPDVLNEEVADTALALLLCTIRKLPQAMRYLQEGKWQQAPFPLSEATLRGRTVGLVGMGRIGQAIARRLEAFAVQVSYHSRRLNDVVNYKYYPRLMDMARDVDVLMVIVPGGAATRNLIDSKVLEALGPTGILINVARGSVVDEAALVTALREKKILSAGLDVFASEPNVPSELVAMEHIVLLPHVGSASMYTRAAMDQLVVDNLLSWASGRGPLTPVAETPTAK
jgi:lactate dehydrogenase-like 2-hydroxyacid dehydrogenase